MKTPEEIKRGLGCCLEGFCTSCSYEKILNCTESVREDALALIQQLEAENAELKRERAAAVNELKLGYACFACSYFFRNGGKCKGGSTCMVRSESCSVFGAEYSGLYFKWRGPCEENGGK